MGDAKRRKDANANANANSATAINLDALHHVYREALCFFEAFRRLNFSADDIYAITAGEDGLVQLSIVLRTQGAECTAVAGFLPDTLAQVADTWADITNRIRDTKKPLDPKQTHRMWLESMACAQFLTLPSVLARKGIRITLAGSKAAN